MARIKGGKLTVTYDTTKRQPLDSRMLVTKVADLINPVTWVVNGTNVEATFNGMIVAVNNDGDYNGIYYLKDRTAISAENFSNYQAALESSQDTKPYFYMWAKVAELDEVELLSERIAAIEKAPERYEVEEVEGLISTLHDRELRINASHVDFEAADENEFNVVIRAYAPKKALYFKHNFGKYVKPQDLHSYANSDGGKSGERIYAKVNLPIAEKVDGQWVYKGATSTEDSFVTIYYSINWYDVDQKLVDMQRIQITLVNDESYVSLLSPAVVEYVKEQLSNYCTKDEVKNIVQEETVANAAQPEDIIDMFN